MNTSSRRTRDSGFRSEAQNPTLAELGVTAADLGRVYDFGDGLDVPAGTPTAFFAPNIDAFREIIGFDCGCVNEYGDWTLGYLSNPGNQFAVNEYDTSYFAQINFDYDILGHRTVRQPRNPRRRHARQVGRLHAEHSGDGTAAARSTP